MSDWIIFALGGYLVPAILTGISIAFSEFDRGELDFIEIVVTAAMNGALWFLGEFEAKE